MSLPPVPQVIASLKARYPGTVLLFRDGVSYVAYRGDAVAVTLATDRPVRIDPCACDGTTISATVPATDIEAVLAVLAAEGRRVAIVELATTVPPGRDVERVVMPGSLDGGAS